MSDAHGWIDSYKTVPADPWCQYFKFNAQLTIRSLGTSPHLYSHPEDRTTNRWIVQCQITDNCVMAAPFIVLNVLSDWVEFLNNIWMNCWKTVPKMTDFSVLKCEGHSTWVTRNVCSRRKVQCTNLEIYSVLIKLSQGDMQCISCISFSCRGHDRSHSMSCTWSFLGKSAKD